MVRKIRKSLEKFIKGRKSKESNEKLGKLFQIFMKRDIPTANSTTKGKPPATKRSHRAACVTPNRKKIQRKKEKPKEGRERRNFRAGRSGEPPELRQPSQEINEIDDVNTRSSAIGYAMESKRYV